MAEIEIKISESAALHSQCQTYIVQCSRMLYEIVIVIAERTKFSIIFGKIALLNIHEKM